MLASSIHVDSMQVQSVGYDLLIKAQAFETASSDHELDDG
jgi:hypothetical protein